MIIKYITIGTTEPIEISLVGATGQFLNNSTPKFSIRRMSDNRYLRFTDRTWHYLSGQIIDFSPFEVTMTQPDPTYSPGKYSYYLDLDPSTFGTPDSYCFRASCADAANSPFEGEIKTQYASFDEAIAAMEETEVIKADVDNIERRVERGMPTIIRKKLSDHFWIELKLWYDYEGGRVIRATSDIIERETVNI